MIVKKHVLRRAAMILSSCAMICGNAWGVTTGSWAASGNTATGTAGDVTITYSASNTVTYGNRTFQNLTFPWSDPYGGTIPGSNGLQVTVTGERTITVTFSQPVDNPVLHVSRIGGTVGSAYNSSIWTLVDWTNTGGGVTMTHLSGNGRFTVEETSGGNWRFRRTTGGTYQSGGDCASSSTATTGMGCGSVQFNGRGITELVFSVTFQGTLTDAGDGLDFIWSIQAADLSVTKTGDAVSVLPGSQITYGIVVSNNGPDAADGAVVKDTPDTGLSCTAVSCGDEQNGAVCPVPPLDVNDLTGSGIAIPTLPAGGSVKFQVTCTVD